MIFAVSVDGKTIRCRPKTLIIPAEPIKCPSTKPAKPTNKPAKKTETKYAVGEALQANPYFKYGYTEYTGTSEVMAS